MEVYSFGGAMKRLPRLDPARFHEYAYADPAYSSIRCISLGPDIPIAEVADITYTDGKTYRGRVLGRLEAEIVLLVPHSDEQTSSATPGAKVFLRPVSYDSSVKSRVRIMEYQQISLS